MDYVYSADMDGRLCDGDSRTRQEPSKQYGGIGGTLLAKYVVSHVQLRFNFRFFGVQPLETFACFDVMKNPDIENDFRRFKVHLDQHFKALLPAWQAAGLNTIVDLGY